VQFLLFKEALHLYPSPIFFISDMSELYHRKTIGSKNPLHNGFNGNEAHNGLMMGAVSA